MPILKRKRATKAAEVPPPTGTSSVVPRRRLGLSRGKAPGATESPAPPPLPPPPEAAPPPPLPAPRPPPPATLDPKPDYSECFVCGTTLAGKTCPKCRMTWVE